MYNEWNSLKCSWYSSINNRKFCFLTFDKTVALLKYNLEFVNLLLGSIDNASV